MTRSVTVQFADGTSHTYDNVPDDVTPDQIEARAQGEFKDRQIQHIARAPLEGETTAEKPQAEKDLEALQSEQIPEAIGYTLGGLGLGYGVAEEGLKGTRNAVKWAERALAGRQPQVGINTNIPTAPTAPTLTASGTTSTTTSLSWSGATDNIGVTGYDVYNGTTLLGSTTTTTYAVSGLTASTSYSFTVKAKALLELSTNRFA